MAIQRSAAIDLNELFQAASGFDAGTQAMIEELRRRGPAPGPTVNTVEFPTLIPQWVTSALTTELYFKCIIQHERGDFAATHHLGLLFGEIAPARQERLRELHEESIAQNRLLAT